MPFDKYDTRNLKILFTCGREPSYPRNSLILSVLQNLTNTQSFTSTSRRILIRYLSIYWQMFFAVRKQEFDLIFVGFLGQPIVPFANRFFKKPILFDAFLSVFDTICYDRQWVSPNSLVGKAAFLFDKISCDQADCVILDTQAHADFFHQQFGIAKEKLEVLFVGCDDTLFQPQWDCEPKEQIVLFYGSYLPLHGVETIVEAARHLRNTSIRFRIIGDGIQKNRIVALAKQHNLTNITFMYTVPLHQLPNEIANATVCLGGPFGPSQKAQRVITGKTFQCIAMGKPTIVGDSQANRELLEHQNNAWFCPMNDPIALTEAIRALTNNPNLCRQLGENAYLTFKEKASTEVLQEKLKQILLKTTFRRPVI